MAHIQSESFDEDGRYYLDTKPLPVPVDPSYNAPPSGFMERIRIGGPYSSQKEADYWSKRASDVQGEKGSVEDYKRFLSPYRENTLEELWETQHVPELLYSIARKRVSPIAQNSNVYIRANLGNIVEFEDRYGNIVKKTIGGYNTGTEGPVIFREGEGQEKLVDHSGRIINSRTFPTKIKVTPKTWIPLKVEAGDTLPGNRGSYGLNVAVDYRRDLLERPQVIHQQSPETPRWKTTVGTKKDNTSELSLSEIGAFIKNAGNRIHFTHRPQSKRWNIGVSKQLLNDSKENTGNLTFNAVRGPDNSGAYVNLKIDSHFGGLAKFLNDVTGSKSF